MISIKSCANEAKTPECNLNHDMLERLMDEPTFRESYEEESLMRNFSATLANIADETGWDEVCLARRLKTPRKNVREYLLGARNVDLKTVARTMYRLGYKVSLTIEPIE